MPRTKALARLLPLSGAFVVLTALTAAASALVIPVAAGNVDPLRLSSLYLDESGLSYAMIDRLEFSK